MSFGADAGGSNRTGDKMPATMTDPWGRDEPLAADFRAKHPTVDGYHVESDESGHAIQNSEGRVALRTGENFLRCRSDLCRDGGINLGDEILEMIKNGETERKSLTICPGEDAAPRGRIARQCASHFRYVIKVSYRSMPPASPFPARTP